MIKKMMILTVISASSIPMTVSAMVQDLFTGQLTLAEENIDKIAELIAYYHTENNLKINIGMAQSTEQAYLPNNPDFETEGSEGGLANNPLHEKRLENQLKEHNQNKPQGYLESDLNQFKKLYDNPTSYSADQKVILSNFVEFLRCYDFNKRIVETNDPFYIFSSADRQTRIETRDQMKKDSLATYLKMRL